MAPIDQIDPKLKEALKQVALAQLPIERRIFRRHSLRHGGQAAFIPSLATYTREDMALLFAAARANGGLLPVEIRVALMQAQVEKALLGEERHHSIDEYLRNLPKPPRNVRKRQRKARRAR